MSTLDNVPQLQDAKPSDSSIYGFVAVGLGAVASLLWVAFLGWGLGWVIAQIVHWIW